MHVPRLLWKRVCIFSLRSTDPEVNHIHNKTTASMSCLGLLCLWCPMHCSLTVLRSRRLCLRKSQCHFVVEHWRGFTKASLTLLFYKLLEMHFESLAIQSRHIIHSRVLRMKEHSQNQIELFLEFLKRVTGIKRVVNSFR